MERKDCEKLLVEKLKEIKEIYKQYNPEGKYLAAYIIKDCLCVNNAYYDEDASKPINISINENEN